MERNVKEEKTKQADRRGGRSTKRKEEAGKRKKGEMLQDQMGEEEIRGEEGRGERTR